MLSRGVMFEGVTKSLADPNFWVRYQAVQLLATQPPDIIVVHAADLAKLLRTDEKPLVRHEAAKAFLTLGHRIAENPDGPDALIRALRDSEHLVRRDGARALHSMGTAVGPYVERVATTALADDFWPVRLWVVRLMGNSPAHGAPHARMLVSAALSDTEASIREAAARSLGTFGADAVPHIRSIAGELMKPSAGTESDERAERAERALASALGAESVAAQKAVRSGLSDLVKLATHGRSADKKHEIAALEVSLIDKEWPARKNAIRQLRMQAMQVRMQAAHADPGDAGPSHKDAGV